MLIKLDGVLRAVSETVWAIEEPKLHAILDFLETRAVNGRIDASEIEAATRRGPQRRSEESIAVLPLFGIISQRMNMMTEFSGGTSTEKFAADFDQLVRDPAVSTIVIQVDSPGGSVHGVDELAQKVFEARSQKRIIAVADPLMASAAYWIASAAHEIVAAPTAEVGSIGVVTVHTDISGRDAQAGIKRTILRAGRFKQDVNAFEPLSKESAEAVQAKLDAVYEMFVSAVARHRGVSAEEVRNGFGEGRALLGHDAVRARLADRVGTLESVLGELLGRSATPSRVAAVATATAGAPELMAVSVEAVTTGINAGDAAGGASPESQEVPEPESAPEAKGETMAGNSATAAQQGAANGIDAEVERVREITKLARRHEIEEGRVDAWIEAGTPAGDVAAEILNEIAGRQKPVASDEIRVGEDREAAKPFESFGEQLLAIYRAGVPGGTPDKRLLYLNRNGHRLGISAAATGMSQSDPASAGYLVAPAFSQRIWDGLNADPDNLLARTDSYPVEGESLTFNANAETSRATGSRWGGVRGYWISEAEKITASKPKFRQVKLEPQQLAVLVYLTEKLLNNAPAALETYVERTAVAEIGFLTGDSIINGDGAGKPVGIMNSGSLVTVSKETGQAANTIVQENISKMWARLHPRSRRNAVWLHNVDVEPQLDALSTTVKNVAGTENVGGYADKVFDPERRTLKGRPLIACEFCETLGTKGDLLLVDLMAYATGVRTALQRAMSIHIRFEYAETAFRFIYEVDGQPWLASALTPFKGSNTLTTHVALATRA